MVIKSKHKQKQWLEQKRHQLRQEIGAAIEILKALKKLRKKKMSESRSKVLERIITYYTNHEHQMNYPQYAQQNLSIGSGVTEAAYKVLVKQRSCNTN